jgi:hypothetical protein
MVEMDPLEPLSLTRLPRYRIVLVICCRTSLRCFFQVVASRRSFWVGGVVVSSSGTSLSPFTPAMLMDEAEVDGQLEAR